MSSVGMQQTGTKEGKKRIDPDSSWQQAAYLLKNTLHFASSFTTTIRTLKLNAIENIERGGGPSRLNEASRFYLMRLVKAPSILAPLFYLTQTYKGRQIEDMPHISQEYLVGLYRLDELSSFLALTFIFNSLRKACDKEEWLRYGKVINEAVEVGGYVGSNISDIGLADGLLLSGVRYLAPAVFLARDPKNFKIYRRDLKIKKCAFHLQMEYDLFGCTHVDIATQLVQGAGFGADYSTDFYKSLMTDPDKRLERRPNLMRIMLLWSEALYLGRKPPRIHGENEIAVEDQVVDQLLLVSKQIQESGSVFSWLSKGKSSITRRLTPQLYGPDASTDFEEEEEAAFT